MARAHTSEPSAVVVGYRPHPGCERALHEVCAGIEEEGVPFRAAALEAGDAAALAHRAATQSELGVGVGIDAGALCVHLAALRPDAPLERLAAASFAPELGRHIGHNAARLVKGMPLKGYDDRTLQRPGGGDESTTNHGEVSPP